MQPIIVHEVLSYVVPGLVAIFGFGFVGYPIARAIAERIITRTPPAPALDAAAASDLARRLERIEQAVDAVAIEVERIAEAQRFAAQLQARDAGARDALPPGR